MYQAEELQTFENFFTSHQEEFKSPLGVGCSGGGGHNSAMTALIQYLILNNICKKEDFYSKAPVSYIEKPLDSSQVQRIHFGSDVMHKKIRGKDVSFLLRAVLEKFNLPLLPDMKSLTDEIEELKKANQPNNSRLFVDMLIDVYPAGYESVAIWNVLQKKDENEELKKLISMQGRSDEENYQIVRDFYYHLLLDELKKGKPRSCLISTQAMALPALCDAVAKYNMFLKENHKEAPEIKIFQFMTDLPTEGAVHFFNSLAKLNDEQRKQMYLCGVDFKSDIVKNFNLNKPPFASLVSIDPENNPMVRPGFRDNELKKLTNFDRNVTLFVQHAQERDEPIKVAAKENVAAIMLGSQAGDDTVDYVRALIKDGS